MSSRSSPIDDLFRAKAEWHRRHAALPIREKVRILLELQRQPCLDVDLRGAGFAVDRANGGDAPEDQGVGLRDRGRAVRQPAPGECGRAQEHL